MRTKTPGVRRQKSARKSPIASSFLVPFGEYIPSFCGLKRLQASLSARVSPDQKMRLFRMPPAKSWRISPARRQRLARLGSASRDVFTFWNALIPTFFTMRPTVVSPAPSVSAILRCERTQGRLSLPRRLAFLAFLATALRFFAHLRNPVLEWEIMLELRGSPRD